jgi:hypothetical protein
MRSSNIPAVIQDFQNTPALDRDNADMTMPSLFVRNQQAAQEGHILHRAKYQSLGAGH